MIIQQTSSKEKTQKNQQFLASFLGSSTRCWRQPTFAKKTIMGSTRLNFSVRNGKRCGPCDKSPTLKTRFSFFNCGLQIS